MNLKLLSTGEMHKVLLRAVTTHRPMLDAEPAYAAVLAAFEALVPDFDSVLPAGSGGSGAGLSDDGKRLDAEHDRLLRNLYVLLEATEALCPGPAAEMLSGVRKRLFPEGLLMVSRTFAEQAVEARRVATRVTPADEELLRNLRLPGGSTAHDVFRAWVATCEALGRFEDRRLAADEDSRTLVLRQVVVRNRWTKAVQALVAQVELLGMASHPVLDDVQFYETRALARSARGSSEDEDDLHVEPGVR